MARRIDEEALAHPPLSQHRFPLEPIQSFSRLFPAEETPRSESHPTQVTDSSLEAAENSFVSPNVLAQDAQELAKTLYSDNTLPTGISYFDHAVRVAQKVRELGNILHVDLDSEVTIAALLANTSRRSWQKKYRHADEWIQRLNHVREYPYLPSTTGLEINPRALVNHMEMIGKMAGSPEVLLLVIADKLVSLQEDLPAEGKNYLTNELKQVYVTICELLGADQLAEHLRIEIFYATNPNEGHRIRDAVIEQKGMSWEEMEDYVEKVRTNMEAVLIQEGFKNPAVYGRLKSEPSISEKLPRKKITLGELLDLWGFRIVLTEKRETDIARAAHVIRNIEMDGQPLFASEVNLEAEKKHKGGYAAYHMTFRDPQENAYEVHFYTASEFQKERYGEQAHWLYNLQKQIKHLKLEQMDVPRAYREFNPGEFRNNFENWKKYMRNWTYFNTEWLEGKEMRYTCWRIPHIGRRNTERGNIADALALPPLNRLHPNSTGAIARPSIFDVYHAQLTPQDPPLARPLNSILQDGEILLQEPTSPSSSEKRKTKRTNSAETGGLELAFRSALATTASYRATASLYHYLRQDNEAIQHGEEVLLAYFQRLMPPRYRKKSLPPNFKTHVLEPLARSFNLDNASQLLIVLGSPLIQAEGDNSALWNKLDEAVSEKGQSLLQGVGLAIQSETNRSRLMVVAQEFGISESSLIRAIGSFFVATEEITKESGRFKTFVHMQFDGTQYAYEIQVFDQPGLEETLLDDLEEAGFGVPGISYRFVQPGTGRKVRMVRFAFSVSGSPEQIVHLNQVLNTFELQGRTLPPSFTDYRQAVLRVLTLSADDFINDKDRILTELARRQINRGGDFQRMSDDPEIYQIEIGIPPHLTSKFLALRLHTKFPNLTFEITDAPVGGTSQSDPKPVSLLGSA